jgi:hypothetical protein
MPLRGYVSNCHAKKVSVLGLCDKPTYHIKRGKNKLPVLPKDKANFTEIFTAMFGTN